MKNNPIKTVRILVLNYNGLSLLKEYLDPVISAAEESRHSCKVTVLDNASVDGSVEFVKKYFPKADVYIAKENKVLCSYNEALKFYTEDIMILLNNDIRPEDGFVDPLIEPLLHDPSVFFTASHGDCPKVAQRWGILSAELDFPGYLEKCEKPGFSFSAGIGAFDREKFNQLGGYDELYLPGRYEDVDLCFRGWKKGWKGVYVPASRKYHVGGASFEKAFNATQTQAMVFRNGILFMAKNITDPILYAEFILLTILKTLGSLLVLRLYFVKGFWGALRRMPAAARARKQAKVNFERSDREVLRAVNN